MIEKKPFVRQKYVVIGTSIDNKKNFNNWIVAYFDNMGTPFIGLTKNRHFCSDKCYKEYNKVK